MEKLIKRFFMYGFFFIFPLTAAFTPEFKTVYGAINSDMLWLFPVAILFIFYVLKYPRKVRFSKLTLALACYYCYMLLNTYLQGYGNLIIKTTVALMATGLFAIMLIEHMDFEIKDRRNLIRFLCILVIAIFIGTLLQVYVDQSLFFPKLQYYKLSQENYAGFWLHSSIFDAMIQNQGGIAFIFIFGILLFLNLKEYHPVYIVLLFLMMMVIYFTYARYVMLSGLIYALFFICLKLRMDKFNNKNMILIGIFVMMLTAFIFYEKRFFQSDLYNVRMLADASGRTEAPLIFLRDYVWKHPVFGTGFSSYVIEYYYGTFRRIHAGVWDVLFEGGAVGLALFLLVLYQLHQRAKIVVKKTGNKVFLLFAPLIFLINLTARLDLFWFWGYILMFYYMSLEDRIANKMKLWQFPVRDYQVIGNGMQPTFLPARTMIKQ
jgi:hypothetical protein